MFVWVAFGKSVLNMGISDYKSRMSLFASLPILTSKNGHRQHMVVAVVGVVTYIVSSIAMMIITTLP
jgi:ABC-type long-subunit fatty acid transport system fused permease/ATPase subunit